MVCLQAGLHPTALTNGSAPHPPAPSADATQPMPWLPASGAPLGLPLHYAPSPPLMGAMLPVEAAQSGQPGSYEGQLVSHIMQYINNLWRVDPSNFSATLNLICMRAPALMQRMMDHELAANAAVDERFAAQQQQPCAAGAIAAAPSMPAFLPSANPLQHPHELEVHSIPPLISNTFGNADGFLPVFKSSVYAWNAFCVHFSGRSIHHFTGAAAGCAEPASHGRPEHAAALHLPVHAHGALPGRRAPHRTAPHRRH